MAKKIKENIDRNEVEKFNSEVDKLQEDFGRVEAKFTELFKNISR